MVSRAFLRRLATEGKIWTEKYLYVAESATLADKSYCIVARRYEKIPLNEPHHYLISRHALPVAIFTMQDGWQYYTTFPIDEQELELDLYKLHGIKRKE